VLAVDPHIRRVAYAFLHRDALADWGTRNVRDGKPTARTKDAIVPLLVRLLDQHEPNVLIVPSVTRGRWPRRSHMARAIVALSTEAVRRGVAVHSLSNEDVKASVAAHVRRPMQNKAALHRVVVRRFPELRASFPRARKLWEAEPYSVRLFNAVAMYLAWRHR
jgi:hypothetical protein